MADASRPVRTTFGPARRRAAALAALVLVATALGPAAAAQGPFPAAPAVVPAPVAASATPHATSASSTLPSGVGTALSPDDIQSFVIAVYVDFLDRRPSSGEIAAWGVQLQNGTLGPTDFTTAVAWSEERVRTVISAFYRDTLSRAPDAAGLANWVRAVQGGMPLSQVAAGFYGSQEYFQTIGRSDYETWVRDLYRKLLLRGGEPAGVARWVDLLRSGLPREQVAWGFYQSPEKLAARVDALYRELLGRSAEPGGIASWSPIVAAQGDLALAATIALSQEYWQRARSRFPSTGAPPSWVEVVGTGTPASCTSAALAAAVRDGGTIVFDCGPNPVTIAVDRTLYTCNTTTCRHGWQGATTVERMTLDGGGLVTLSGGGVRGIFYANACQESFGWTSGACQNDTRPHITFQNITFENGNAQGPPAGLADVGGGGAIAMRSGRLTLDHVTFRNNTCITAHSDWGGGAVRVFGMTAPVEVTGSVFENNRCANGGALSSLHAPMVITDSVFTGNRATGSGASSGQGGNGGAIYFDGTGQNVVVRRTTITGNVAPEGGPGIFYVSNDRSGSLTIEGSTITGNTGQRFYTSPYRNLYFLGRALSISGSTVQ